MIRPITCLCVISAAASGLYLYQTKHITHMLDRQIEQTMQAANAVREHSQVLRAEWANLNDTTRLADLAGRHLNLRQVMPAQFVTLAELDHRLPATRSFAPPDATPPDLAPPPADVPMAQAAPPNHPVAAAQAAPAAAPATHATLSTVQTASVPSAVAALPPQPQSARLAAVPTPLLPQAARPPAIRNAAADQGETPEHETRSRETAARETVMPAPTIKPVITQAMATSLPRAAARVAYEPALPPNRLGRPVPIDGAVPPVASALGNAHTSLAPPVPVAVSATGLSPR